MDDEGTSAWVALLRAHAAVVRRLSRELEERRGLPLSWYDVLDALQSAPERRLRMQQLGNAVVLSRSRVSRIVDDLEREGLVTRQADPTDARASFTALTPAGRSAIRKAAPVYAAALREHFAAHVSPADLRALRRALERVAQAAEPRRR